MFYYIRLNQTTFFTKIFTVMKKILMLLAMAVSFAACKKSNDNCSLSASAIVGDWKLTAVNYKATPSSTEVNIFNDDSWYSACDRDNIFRFRADNSYSYVDTGTVCGSGGDGYDDGTWVLSGNAFVWDGYQDTVSSFSCNSMTITEHDYDVSGDVAKYVFTRK